MEQRPLGRTGLTVSALGFGCGAIGGLMTKGDSAEQTRAAARAIEAGITYFDTARSYGDGKSEENLGRVLEELKAWDKVVVGTKFRVEPNEVDDAEGAIRRSLEGSLKRLRHDWVHLFQLHNAIKNEPDGRNLTADQVLGPVWQALDKLRGEGLIRHVGVTATGDTEAATQVVASGQYHTAQVYFNVLNPSAGYPGRIDPGDQDFGGLIDRAKQAGVGVINIRPLAAGAVSANPNRHANAGDPGRFGMAGISYQDDLARAQSLYALSGEMGHEGPVESALRFVMAKDGVSTVIVGYSEMSQLEDAIRWAERGGLDEHHVGRTLKLRDNA